MSSKVLLLALVFSCLFANAQSQVSVNGGQNLQALNGAPLTPEKVMELSSLGVGYKTPIITTPEELIVRKDEKIGIIGRNGAGKTTFLKTIL